MGRRGWAAVAAVVAGLWGAPEAAAHGIWGHVHVTGWAVENLPDGELRTFLSDPEVFNALLFGAAFTDSGYWPQGGELAAKAHAYGEHTHWEPFIEDFVQWLADNDPPPWTSLESKKRVAFLMGCASHGLQDEIFDSLFLYQADENDGAGQGEADPGTDGFLALDGHLRFVPEPWYPVDTLLELYAMAGLDTTADVMAQSVDIMTFLYVNGELGREIARTNGHEYLDVIPWTAAHYMDPDIPGALRAEIFPTARYLEALWARLHGDYGSDVLVTHAYPEPPRRLRSHEAGTVDGWVTLIFGVGAKSGSATTSWVDADQTPVTYQTKATRWGNSQDWGRLMRLQPTQTLAPGGWYTVRLEPGVERIDGVPFEGDFELSFQVACDATNPDGCPPLDPPVATIDPPAVAEPTPDVTESDAITEDLPPSPDPGPEPTPDTSDPDPDSDASLPEPAVEAPSTSPPRDDGGCTGGLPSPWWLSALGLLLRRRNG